MMLQVDDVIVLSYLHAYTCLFPLYTQRIIFIGLKMWPTIYTTGSLLWWEMHRLKWHTTALDVLGHLWSPLHMFETFSNMGLAPMCGLYLQANNDMYKWNQVNCIWNHYTNVRTNSLYNQCSFPKVSCTHHSGAAAEQCPLGLSRHTAVKGAATVITLDRNKPPLQ